MPRRSVPLRHASLAVLPVSASQQHKLGLVAGAEVVAEVVLMEEVVEPRCEYRQNLHITESIWGTSGRKDGSRRI
jgi:hypothetical protein